MALNLAADNTGMDITSGDLMKAEFPGAKDTRIPLDNYHTLLSNERPRSSWAGNRYIAGGIM
ncbi:MAG: hypothetical protein LBD55_08460 [Treponema sp.]|nr:hypothetical protein [Treponema sp.]